MKTLRRYNARGGAIFRRGELIPRRRLAAPDPPPVNPIAPYYDTAVLVHLEMDHATLDGTGGLAGITNPGALGPAGDATGTGQAIEGGLWLNVDAAALSLAAEFELLGKHLLFPIFWPVGNTRPLNMAAGTDSALVLNYSGSGTIAGCNVNQGGASVMTTPRVTAPVSGGGLLVEFEAYEGTNGLGFRYYGSGLGSGAQTVYPAFPLQVIGGALAAGMTGRLGDVVMLDTASDDFGAAWTAARGMLTDKYGLTPITPVFPILPLREEEA